jgi:hypothetical protein
MALALVLMILGFIWWWPVGLIILAFLIARGRFGHWHRPSFAGSGPMWDCEHNTDRWDRNMDRWERKMARVQEKMDRKMDRVRDKMERFVNRGEWWRPAPSSSGNRAFDDYRSETLKRLEEEQREFKEFLERLRFAKDRSEFDQFMNDRRNRPPEAPGPQPQA